MASLLGQFYSKIRGSQEDIASESLVYILQRSFSARRALQKMLQTEYGLNLEEIQYSSQNIGENLARPDISGHDAEGKELLIIEAKFWASLTENQPVEYLRRLGEKGVLLFICPSLRRRTILHELHKRLIDKGVPAQFEAHNHSFLLAENKILIVKAWQEILSVIRLELVQANELSLISDIDQVMGLCEMIDNNSFLPYQSEDFAPAIAKKINSHYDIVLKVVEELKNKGFADTQGLNPSAQKYGYARYFKIGELGISFMLNMELWAQGTPTPFWLNIKDKTEGQIWSASEEFNAKIKKIALKNSIFIPENSKRTLNLPIFPLLDHTEDAVVNDIAAQILALVKELK